ncbi:DUF2680 domain-containing protein [Desulfosporosinus metallidurans]|uniref:DUF2680 domain-containing protein n=1 Tax=Desulfosporosinus metallidurans TaxID=1888891 RepID=A0A1Q8QNY4_9FIRM|nr:DUF2680 domain-containing protein [Desulfosporosinus metallidurans]OLN29047.1 hypothetical protein DSOL_3708 [Desulfosporosinus metallidurans]
MKNIKKLIASATIIGVLGVVGTAYAAVTKSPAEITAGLTGQTVTEVNQQRASGKTYGTIAKDAGKLAEFQAQTLEQKKAILDQRVKDGQLTQQQADQIYSAIETNQVTCDGTGSAQLGKTYGLGLGKGTGLGAGQGLGKGNGSGRRGNGMGSGICTGIGTGINSGTAAN